MRKVFKLSRVWVLVPTLVLFCQVTSPAHADGVNESIKSLETKTSKVTGAGEDSFKFDVPQGGSFVLGIAETGKHDKGFVAQLELIAPDGNSMGSITSGLYAQMVQEGAAAGPWTAKVSRHDGGGQGGAYALHLVQVPGTAGTAMTPDKVYKGANTRGQLDVYTFSGTAGRKATLTLSPTGGKGFEPGILVFGPDGTSINGTQCPASCRHDVPVKADGTYTVVAGKYDENDVPGKYTLSVSGK